MDKIKRYLIENYPNCRYWQQGSLIWIYRANEKHAIKIYDINYLNYIL